MQAELQQAKEVAEMDKQYFKQVINQGKQRIAELETKLKESKVQSDKLRNNIEEQNALYFDLQSTLNKEKLSYQGQINVLKARVVELDRSNEQMDLQNQQYCCRIKELQNELEKNT